MTRILLPFYRLLAHLGCLLLFYFCFRLFFYAFNHAYFPPVGAGIFRLLFGGIRFDISIILVINSLFIFLMLLPFDVFKKRAYQRLLKWVFLLSNGLALLFEAADWIYFPFNHKRATSEVLDLISHKGDFLDLLPGFLVDYWYIFLLAAILLLLLYKTYGMVARHFETRYRLSLVFHPEATRVGKLYAVRVFVLVAASGLAVVGIRGGTQLIPINIRNAVELTRSEFTPILLNTPFSIVNSLANGHLEPKQYMASELADKLIGPVKNYGGTASFRKKNVVFIILESFSKEFTKLGPGKSYTPFLDSLMDLGMTFTNAYANGLHSAEGIPAVLAGIPSLMNEYFTTSVYSNNRINSVPGLLRAFGYKTAFYHGASNGSMSFDIFAKAAGVDRYYGRSEYHNDADYDGNWGIYDEPFLQYFAKGLNALPEPFCATVFTVTSHPPFPLPPQYKGVFPEGKLPIYPCLGYTDMALRRFFDSVKDKSWFRNTVFVITPDHCSPVASDDYYATGTGRYQIPVLFYAPGDSSLRGYNPVLMQQIDILPSVLDYLHYPDSFFALGNSVFREAAPRFVINRLSEVYTWIHKGRQSVLFGDSVREAYAYPGDTLRLHNLLLQQGYQRDSGSRCLFQALVQVYNQAMIQNKMTVATFDSSSK
jgi:phosphoglycerol transferase MdoB-like AlkP superfamily enzyme